MIDYLQNYKNELSDDSKKRLENGALRILDSKDKSDIKIIENAPNLANYYSDEDKKYFDDILQMLEKINIKYAINKRLVRGLDYYTGIVFEFVANNELTVLGGGRYDNLVEQIGGKVSLPAIGFAAGIERLMLYSKQEIEVKPEKFGVIYYSENEIDYAMQTAQNLRNQEKSVEIIYSNSNVGKKIAKANQLGCTKVVVCGPEEKQNNTISIKELF